MIGVIIIFIVPPGDAYNFVINLVCSPNLLSFLYRFISPLADLIPRRRNKRFDFVWDHLLVLVSAFPRFALVQPRCPNQSRCWLLWPRQYPPSSCSPLQATIRLGAVCCVALLDPRGGSMDCVRFWVLILVHLGKASTLDGTL